MTPGDVHALEEKLDAVGYAFFVPVFFVSSGMGLDVRSIVRPLNRLVLFFLLLLAVVGAGVLSVLTFPAVTGAIHRHTALARPASVPSSRSSRRRQRCELGVLRGIRRTPAAARL